METTLRYFALVALTALPVGVGGQQAAGPDRLNPLIGLHERQLPVFGLYAPRGRDGAAAGELARETLGFGATDYLFDGSMEGGIDRGLPGFETYVAEMRALGASARTHPLVVKTPKISADPEAAIDNIGRQLNAGASGIVFVGVESAEEVRRGLEAMRFRSRGGTRSPDVGDAPKYWGVSESEYRSAADLWPLNPAGELVNWTIVESQKGLDNVREIAAVEGIGVLFPGAGTLRRLFSTTGPDGRRVVDESAWERAIQQVLAACREFDVPCGYPANERDIEQRMQQGFSVFVIGWGEGGFRAVDIGRRAAGR